MSELGEGVAATKPVEAVKKGKVKVSVRDKCTEERIIDATVIVNGKPKKTVEGEDVIFDDQSIGAVSIKVTKHFKEADYVTFIVHTLVASKNNITRSWEAKSSADDLALVEGGKETKVRVDMVVYKVIDKIVFHRNNIIWNANEDEDKYGHWWTVVDENTSYGWWPKYRIGSEENRTSEPPKQPEAPPLGAGKMQRIQYMFDSAIYSVKSKVYTLKEGPAGQTLRGVEGELNAKIFGGTETKDPHHVKGDQGEQQYQPVQNDCRQFSNIKESITAFAKSYSSKYGREWSWRAEGGNHCHTFQKRLMKDCQLEKVKVLK